MLLVWLLSPAWDAVKLACQKAVFIFPGHRRATTVVLQDECLTPFYLSPTQNLLPFTQLVLKLVVCVAAICLMCLKLQQGRGHHAQTCEGEGVLTIISVCSIEWIG
jgi:hypothetical protein